MYPDPAAAGHLGEPADIALPPWLSCLPRRREPREAPCADSLRARRAAVLVVLVDGDGNGDGGGDGDGDGEPELFLTRRSDGLEYLPGALVFPGGSVERSDRSPVDTALREANEETGLDPSSVQILGRLPDRTTPDARFMVTPVIAWSRHLRFNSPTSPDEVAAMGLVCLATLARLQADSREALQLIAGREPETQTSGPPGVLPPMTAAVVSELARIVNDLRRELHNIPEGGGPAPGRGEASGTGSPVTPEWRRSEPE